MCVYMCRPAVDDVGLSAHSGRTEQNNPPENHLTLHQGLRLANTARYFFFKVLDSQMSLCLLEKRLLQFHTCIVSKKKKKISLGVWRSLHRQIYSHKDTHCNTHSTSRAREHNTQWSHFSHDPHQLSVSL